MTVEVEKFSFQVDVFFDIEFDLSIRFSDLIPKRWYAFFSRERFFKVRRN